MIEEVLIRKRLADIQYEIVPQDINSTYLHRGRMESLAWVLSEEGMKTEKQIETKIETIKEEMIPLQSNDILYQEKEARIKELKFCMGQKHYFL